MAENPNPSRPVFAGEYVVDIVIGTNPRGEPKMLPVRITAYRDPHTRAVKAFHTWIAKRPSGLDSDAELRRYIDKQIRRHVRRFFG
jgi:hypothetical protein